MLLQKYLKDEHKELQALYALQALMVEMEQPASEYHPCCDHAKPGGKSFSIII